MYDVLIADDEFIVREGIRKKIKWDELGFNNVYTAEDGRAAIEMVEKHNPHLVITDIYMPFVDGLQLSEYLYVNYPGIKIVIITGYDDFDYVRKALKYKVNDYILKPITSGELTELLKKIKNELDTENEKSAELEKLKALLDENKRVIKERFLNRLIKGETGEGELFSKLEFFGIPHSSEQYIVAVLDIDSSSYKNIDFGEYGDELLYYSIFNVAEEYVSGLSDGGAVFQNQSSQSVIIFWGDGVNDKCGDVCKKIMTSLSSILMFTVTVGLSRVFSEISKIRIHYEEAQTALEHRFIMGNNRIIKISDTRRSFAAEPFNIDEHESKILLAIKTEDDEMLCANISTLFKSLKESEMSIDSCYTALQQLLFKLQLLLDHLDFDINELMEIKTNIIVEIYKYETLDEIEQWLLSLCRAVNRHMISQRDSYSQTLVLKATDYLKQNYGNPELSVNVISRYLSISGSYFSMIFKSNTGETFIEYLTKLRLEKAKELLKTTSLKTYEISEKVGYTDSHYFSILFKKHIGKSPTAYRTDVKEGV